MIKKTLTALFVLSIITNIYLVSYVLSKGIIVNNYTTNHQEQMQFQGQLLVNQWTAQGDTIEWKVIYSQDEPNRSLMEILNSLHPISSFYSKISLYNGDFCIIYPTVFSEKEVKK